MSRRARRDAVRAFSKMEDLTQLLRAGTDLGAMQGYGPVLMAGAEVIAMLRSFDISHTLNTFHYKARKP